MPKAIAAPFFIKDKIFSSNSNPRSMVIKGIANLINSNLPNTVKLI